jgi:hypothetical protein
MNTSLDPEGPGGTQAMSQIATGQDPNHRNRGNLTLTLRPC